MKDFIKILGRTTRKKIPEKINKYYISSKMITLNSINLF